MTGHLEDGATQAARRSVAPAAAQKRVIMSLIPDPSHDGRTATPAFEVLANWYAAHPLVRRLWAVQESQRMRVIVTLEPTPDSDDLYPAWLANGHDWAHELQLRMEVPVQLEVILEAPAGLAAGVEGVLVAELLWRDPNYAA